MLNAFKIKPFDLQPIYEEWKDGPVFNGNPKKDMPVEEWLDKIKEGCVKRGVPEEYWYKVAQHFMGPKAKARLDELKEVIRKVHGGKYRWTWKKFRIAILNMGWNIDKSETRTINWKPSSSWFARKKDKEDSETHEVAEPEPVKKDFVFPALWPSRRGSVSETQQTDTVSSSHKRPHARPPARRAATEQILSSETKHETKRETPAHRPSSARRPSSTRRPSTPGTRSHPESTSSTRPPSRKPSLPRSQTLQVTEIQTPGVSQNEGSQDSEVQAQAQAPVWLLNACNALDFITSEHPKAMNVISAILITVGSIPAIPAISAGAGGAILASGAAHAIGAIAVGVGQAISLTVKSSQQTNQNDQQNQKQITNGAQNS